MIMFLQLPLISFIFHPTFKYSEPGYIDHLRTLNTFSFPVSVQCRQVPLYVITFAASHSALKTQDSNHASLLTIINVYYPPYLVKQDYLTLVHVTLPIAGIFYASDMNQAPCWLFLKYPLFCVRHHTYF